MKEKQISRDFFSKLNREKIAYLIFYAGITLELLLVLYDKSELHSLNRSMWFRVTFLLFVTKVMMTKYTIKEWCWMIGLGVVGLIAYLSGGRNDMLRLVVMCAAFKDLDYKKVMKYVFYVMLSGCLLIIFLAVTGIFGEISMTAGFRQHVVQTRYCFGFGHPNQMHCMFFVVATLGVYVFWDKMNWIWFCSLMAANMILYLFTDSRGGVIGMSCTFLVSMLLKYVRRVRESKAAYVFVSICLILVGIFSVATAFFGIYYHDNYDYLWANENFLKFFQLDDKFLSCRLWYCYGLLSRDARNFSLFAKPTNVDYMDMGFYKLFYWYGYIPAILFLVANILLLRYAFKKKEENILMMVACFSAYTFLEAHLISDYLGRNYLFLIMGGVWSQVLHANLGETFGWWNIPSSLCKALSKKR